MLSLFPRGVLDEILNLIESVSEGFSFLHFRYTYCVLCADVLSSVFITCDFCVLTFEFHVLSFPFCVLCHMF